MAMCVCFLCYICVFFFKQKTAYELLISDWSSDVCSSDLFLLQGGVVDRRAIGRAAVVSLPVLCRGIVDLEKEFEQLPIVELAGIEDDLDRLGMRAVVAIRGIGHIPAGIAQIGRAHV